MARAPLSQPGSAVQTDDPNHFPSAKRSNIWPWLLGGVIALVLLGYFVAVPYYQLSQYRHEAQHRHQALVLAVKPFVDTFLSDVTSDSSSTTEQALKQIDVAQKYIDSAQDLVRTNRPALSSFKPLPLLDMTYPGYNAMKRTAELEIKYVNAADKMLEEGDAATKYSKDFVSKLGAFASLESKAENLSGDDPRALATQVDAIANDMQLAVDGVAALTPPADFKTLHDKIVTSLKSLVANMRDLAKGARTLDLNLIASATTRLESSSKTLEDASDQFEKDYSKNSQMAKKIAELQDLEKQIKY